jgi:hypothetical protein
MTKYIPPNDADFLAWMNNFISVLNANLATFWEKCKSITLR